jgi:hypothetical protein
MVKLPNPVGGEANMKDKRMKVLGLLTALSLAVCLISSNVVSNTGFSYAQTSGLEWTRITIPGEDDMQLYPGYDIGPMAVSLDGATVFAAVQNELILTDWDLLKSIDGAFTWQDTGLSNAMAAIVDTGDIVAIELSPSWNTDGTIFVSTENRVYYSEDRGRTFDDLNPVPGTIYAAGTDVITSLDLALDSSGRIVVAVGTANPAITTTDVYILDIGGWVAQGVGAYDVLAVGLSHNYATDEAIIAIVTDATKTVVRTKLGIGAWGAAVFDATIKDQGGLDFTSYRGCIEFPNDYNVSGTSGALKIYVGLSATGPGPVALGDVFSIQWAGLLVAPTIADLNVRGHWTTPPPPAVFVPEETNIWSIAVSGDASSTVIIAGTEEMDPLVSPTPGQFLVYTSNDSGQNWTPTPDTNEHLSYKQPTGETEATVVMTSSVAYVGTFGDQSAVSAALTAEGGGFNSWNQRGLIDTVIDEITDMSPSEGYFSDGTIFITTMDTGTGDASLWRTVTEGRTWERVYCSTLVLSPAICIFNMVRLTSGAVIVAQSGSTAIVPSLDDGATFQATRNAQQPITAFTVKDASTYYTGDANGVVWRTINAGATWTSSSGSEIPIGHRVIDLVIVDAGYILAGTNQGGVYRDSGDLVFVPVDPENSQPGAPGDIVHVAPNPCDEDFVYAGIQGGAAKQGIWRFDMGDDEAEWEHIADGTVVGDITSIACSDCIGADSVLYAVSPSTGTGWRSVNPTSIRELPVFEEIDKGLGAGDSVRRGLKLVSGSNLLFAVGGASYTQIWTSSDEIVKMKLLAPEDGSMSGTIMEDEAFLGRAVVMLEWKEIEGAESYEVQIGFCEDLDRCPVDLSYYDGGTPYTEGMVKVAYPWLGTKYYWRVRVGKAGPSGTEGAPYLSQWSETWSFTTPLGPAPSTPGLLSPQPGQEDVILRPVLQWNSSVAATSYELILAANCDWNNPVLNLSGESAISDTAYQITFDLAKNTSYCWQVRGVNDITHSPWSDTGTFTTGFTAEAENAGLPVWVWVIIALASILILSILVLIVRSRRY